MLAHTTAELCFCSSNRKMLLLMHVAASRQDGPGYMCRQVRQVQDGAPSPKSKRVAKRRRDNLNT
ncbi:hypothetical protein V1527DRAFT_461557 [Lipomyces starkeyi]